MEQPDAVEGVLAFLEKRQPHWLADQMFSETPL
jgi:hypothetical protein